MNVYSFLSTVAFTIYGFLTVHMVRRPRHRNAERWVFAAFSLLYAAWSAMYAFMSSTESSETAWLLIHVFSFSWTLSASAFLHFALLHAKILEPRHRFAQLAVYAPGLVFAVKGAAGPLFFDTLVRVDNAWLEITVGSSLWALAYLVFYYASILVGLFFIGRRAWRSTVHRERQQARVIISGYLLTALLVGVNTMLQPVFGVQVPRVPHLVTLVWIGAIWYAIERYDFLGEVREETVRNPLWQLFTRREHEIIALLIRGRSYREIGEDLNISYHTVKSHVERIYTKAEVNNKAQLLFELGSSDPPDSFASAR